MTVAILVVLVILVAMVVWVGVLVGRLRTQVRRSRQSVDAVGERVRTATAELEEEQTILQVESAAVQTSARSLVDAWRRR